jgi:hypothetical protein
LCWRYLRPTPERLGLAPDGDSAWLSPCRTGRAQPPTESFAALVFNRSFVTLSVAFALGMFAQVGVTAHLVTRLVPLVGVVHAAMAVSLATACAVIGRVLLGVLPGDADRRVVAAANFAMQAFGVSLLAIGSSAVVLVPGCILFGLGIGNLLTLPPLIAQREYVPGDVPRVVALITAFNQAVFAFAPAVVGVIREATGGYALAFLVAVAV